MKNSDTEIQPFTRILAVIIVPILLAAFIMLFIFPGRTEQLFAWRIDSAMTAMMLGATYLGGAYFFSRVVMAKQWHEVKLGFLPVSAFAGTLGIATALHWDKFTQGHISFQLWALLYFVLPFVIPVAWYLNNKAFPSRKSPTTQLPQTIRALFGGLGVLLTVVSLLMLLAPALMMPTWPWNLTPLTTRVMAAMFILTGLVGLGVSMNGSWGAARFILHAQVIAIVFILISAGRAAGEFDWSSGVSWLFTGGLTGVLLLALFVLFSLKPKGTG